MYDYGLVGNCQAAALIQRSGSIDWLCLPRPDSPPVFGRLLDPEGGHFSIALEGECAAEQRYIPNTNVLVTTIRGGDESSIRITDFSPRFQQHGRMFRPNALFRILEPVQGSPKVRISCRPVRGWDKEAAAPVRGNSHLRFEIRGEQLRVATNMPITYLCEETPFALKDKVYFGLTWGLGIEEDLATVAQSFLKQTTDYWNVWVKHCSIPSLYQAETIRSALTLKLHCYEDTGAILAALTTSLPEENGSGRNWDYRFCWLRDAYFVLSAFHNLGHFEEMEGFIKFLLNVAEKYEHSRQRLRPVYKLDQSLPLPEAEHPRWLGFKGCVPVRSNNQAAEHVQNDVYGEMILTLAPIYFDERFQHLRSDEHEKLLGHLGALCAANVSRADAGLWELRNGWQEHSFSNLMCWAGIERLQRIREKGYLRGMGVNLDDARARAEASISASVMGGSLRNGPTDSSHDAALLQLPMLRYPDAGLCRRTVIEIARELKCESEGEIPVFLYRYLRKDDFGHPKSAFLICSFWLVQAMAKIGQVRQARQIMRTVMMSANSLGLFSEHYFHAERRQAGNFPQAYSHVGQINAAFLISPPWYHVL